MLTRFFSSLSLSKVSLSTSLTTVGSPKKQASRREAAAQSLSVHPASLLAPQVPAGLSTPSTPAAAPKGP